MAADLAGDTGVLALWSTVDAMQRVPKVFINNAGFGLHARAVASDDETLRRMIHLNAESVMRLTLEAAKRMTEVGGGTIVNVSSTAAFQAVPSMAVYAATKAFVLSFSEALHDELRGSGVNVLAFCPGAIRTEFQAIAGLRRPAPDWLTAAPSNCARQAVNAIDHGESGCLIDGAMNRVTIFIQRCLPRKLVVRLSGMMTDDCVERRGGPAAEKSA